VVAKCPAPIQGWLVLQANRNDGLEAKVVATDVLLTSDDLD